MAQDYKLCPQCNNALDNNVMQCPYCGKNLGISFGINNYSNTSKPPIDQKNSKGCVIFIIIFIVIPFVWIIFSFILGVISSFFS